IERPPRSPLVPYTTLFRSSVGLRRERLRQYQAWTLARSIAARVGQTHRRLGRERGEDPDLLLALRRSPSERHQAQLHRAYRRGVDRKSTRLNSSHQIISYA